MEIKKGFELFNSKNMKRIKYRFVILRDDSFQEVTSFKLTATNLLVIGSTISVTLIFITAVLIMYTPMKYYIPGYQSSYGNSDKLKKLMYETDSLERAAELNNKQITNLYNILTGNIDSTYTAKKKSNPMKGDTSELSKLSDAELKLRREMALNQNSTLQYSNRRSGDQNGDAAIYELHFFPPVKGFVTSAFDSKKSHFGIDVAAPKNEPIKSCLEGTVISAGWSMEGGFEILIQHPHNIVSCYKHNSKLLKKTGNFVNSGEVIGIIGNSGELSTGPHLHFELWNRGVAINPESFIKFN